MSDGQVARCARELVVEGHFGGEAGLGDAVDDDVVGAGDEGLALPGAPHGRADSGGEVDLAAVVLAHLGGRAVQPYLEGGVEGLHPLEFPAVGEGLGGGDVPGQQPVLEQREFVGEGGR